MEKNENGRPILRENATVKREGVCDEGLQLAMVYSPYQSFRMLYSPDTALKRGTLFEELYKPLSEVCHD